MRNTRPYWYSGSDYKMIYKGQTLITMADSEFGARKIAGEHWGLDNTDDVIVQRVERRTNI